MTSSASRRVLVTGATGCVGRAVLRRAAAEGWETWALTRSGHLPEGAGARPITGSLSDLPVLARDLPPMTSCIHLAAAVHGAESDPESVFRINASETLAAARALAARGCLKRFVLASSIAADDSESASPYARSKARAEAELRQHASQTGYEAPILRLATVYGPGDRGNIGSLFGAIRRKRYVRIVPPTTLKTLLWVESAAAALIAAADPAKETPDLSVVADAAPYPFSEIEDAMFAAANVRPSPRIPSPIAWIPALMGSTMELLTSRPAPISAARLKVLRRHIAMSPGPASAVNDASLCESIGLVEAFRRSYAATPCP